MDFELDTVRAGVLYKQLHREDAFKLFERLNYLSSDSLFTVIRGNQNKGVYQKSLKIFKADALDIKKHPYLYINYQKRLRFRNAYDVKLSAHLGRFDSPKDYFDMIAWSFKQNLEELVLQSFNLCEVHLKKDLQNPGLNFFLKHLTYAYARNPFVLRNPQTTRRTFYLNKNVYLYEKFIEPSSILRFEMRYKSQKKVKSSLGISKLSEIKCGVISFPSLNLFKLVYPRSRDPTIRKGKRFHEAVLSNARIIDKCGEKAENAYQIIKADSNTALRGKFNAQVEKHYKITDFKL